MPLNTPHAWEIRQVSVLTPKHEGDSIMVTLYEQPRQPPVLELFAKTHEQATSLIFALEEAARQITRTLEALPREDGKAIPCQVRRDGVCVAHRGAEREVAA